MDNAIDEDARPSDSKYWLGLIDKAQRWSKDWYERGEAVNTRYLDKKDESKPDTLNTLWSNIQTIMPALYAKTPTPAVSRRHRDKDPVGRWGAIVLERALDYQLDAYDVDYSIRSAVLDYLLPGRGQVWVHYEPTIKDQTLAWERCKTEHLNWKDFLYSPARTWEEVWWVAKRAYMTREEVEKRPNWGKAIADQLVFDERGNEDSRGGEDKEKGVKKAAIWEIWCKTTNLVYFVSRNCLTLLEKPKPPFLNFEGFFPCPRPLMASVTTEKYLPTPDFCQYQNQADEIDKLTQRIKLMTDALVVVGIYDATQESLGRLLERRLSNEMIACSNWALMAQAGGLKGAVDFFPLDQIIGALKQCYESREAAKQAMYEVTGISDIVRGASDPNETLGAQQIKTQWGGLRIRDRQAEVQRFVRDVLRLNSEIIAEHFQLETLKTMSNAPILMGAEKQQLEQRKQFAARAQAMAAQNPQLAQQIAQANPQLAQMAQPLSPDDEQKLREPVWEEIYQLLRDEKLRCYRIGIETDSTIQADEMEEKAQRTEFVTATTGFITAWGPIIMAQPKMIPLAAELLKFAARGFKTADLLETSIDEAMDALTQASMMPQPQQPPDPKLAADKAKADAEMAKQHDVHQMRREEMVHEQQMAMATQDHERGQRAHEMQMAGVANEGETIKANAGKPSPADVTGALAPLFEIVQQQVAAMAQMAAQTQAQMVQSNTQMMQQFQQTMAMLAGIAAAPKEVKFKRGAGNLIEGAIAKPVLQ